MHSYTCSLRLALFALALFFGMEGSGMMIGNTGAFLAGRLPYDAEVEYLQSDGRQTIATGITQHELSQIHLKFLYSKFVRYGNIFYSEYFAEGVQFTRIILGKTDGPETNYVNWQSSTYRTLKIPKNIINDVIMNARVFTCNGVPGSAPSVTGNASNREIILFSAMQKGYSADIGCQIYLFQMWGNEGNLIRDFIPVRFTNELGQSEGAMYDRANPTVGMDPDGSPRTDGLYRNRGKGSFVIGPDKTA